MRRRTVLAAAAGAALATACAHAPHPPDRIVELASGRELTRTELLAALRQADHVLLGERHDNPLHHERRGRLIAELGAGAVVVAEHLPRGARVGPGGRVLERLQAAGFESKPWQWPLHRALFAPILAAGLPLLGGNADRQLVRTIARDGPSAWPDELRRVLDDAPLDAAAQAALDRQLQEGHCGQLPAARVPAMRSAQRSRDASMALALCASGGRPAVLVAGNGHVALDYGVGQLLRRLQPGAKVLSVGFGEPETAGAAAPYTYLWVTAGVDRDDPCAGFKMPQRTV